MKTIKTKIGEVGFIETNDTHENSMKKIPKGWRAIEDYEILQLWNKENKKIKNLLDNKKEEVWIKNRLFLPVVLGYFNYNWFSINCLVIIRASRGVVVIKKGDAKNEKNE